MEHPEPDRSQGMTVLGTAVLPPPVSNFGEMLINRFHLDVYTLIRRHMLVSRSDGSCDLALSDRMTNRLGKLSHLDG